MTLPAPIADKLGKLLPRLASDHDGEIVATVRAIRRTLQSARLDLHDLARRLSSEGPRPEPRAQTYEPPRARPGPWRWRNLASNERVLALDGIYSLRLSPWEKEFIKSIDARLRACPHATFSQRQIEILNGLLHRVWESEQ